MVTKQKASSETETQSTSAGYTHNLSRDILRRHGIRPYHAVNSGLTVQDVYDNLNALLYKSYSPDYRLARNPDDRLIADPIFNYERLLRGLNQHKHLQPVTFHELEKEPDPLEVVRYAIRHDVDVDIRAGLMCAELEHQYGIRTTYFILHTVWYYGYVQNGIFHRHDSMINVYKRIQDLGHEVALHTDPLMLYQDHKIDGARALENELSWLRSHGIKITGSVGHNGATTYGAENRGIFKGCIKHWHQKVPKLPDDATEVVWNGKWAPLQVLDEKELGLIYEANNIMDRTDVPWEYGATRFTNSWTHLLYHRDTRKENEKARGFIPERKFKDQDDFVRRLGELKPPNFAILVVHPVYYGARLSPNSSPFIKKTTNEVIINPELGWETYKPFSRHCLYGEDENGRQEFQSYHFANEWGMLDIVHNQDRKPGAKPPKNAAQDELRILILGGTNIAGTTTAIPAQFQSHVAEVLNEQIGKSVKIWKMAIPGMGLTRHFSWYQRGKNEINPQVVILGIGADEVMTSLPEYWSQTTGFSAKHPPGDYLTWKSGQIHLIQQSSSARIRRKGPRSNFKHVSLTQDPQSWELTEKDQNVQIPLQECLSHYVRQVQIDGRIPLLLMQESGESIGLWSTDTNLAQRRKGYKRAKSFLSGLSQQVKVDLIDPYESILAEQTIPTHWNSVAEWNYTGNRLVAETLVAYFFEKLIHNLDDQAQDDAS